MSRRRSLLGVEYVGGLKEVAVTLKASVPCVTIGLSVCYHIHN